MGFLNNIFNNDARLDSIDKEIESIIQSVPIKDINTDTTDTNSSEILHQLLSVDDDFSNEEKLKKNPFYKDFKENTGIVSEVSTLLDKLSIQADRANRYKIYEEIYSSVPIIKRMMKTWLSNLVQKNPVTGKSLITRDRETDSNIENLDDDYRNKKEAVKVLTNNIVDYFEIVHKLKYRILPTQQLYGDCFVEVINLKDFSLDQKSKTGEENYFLGEGLGFEEIPTSKTILEKKELSNEDKIKKINDKLNSSNNSLSENSLNEIYDLISDFFVDEYVNEDVVVAESEAVKLDSRKSKIITLNENHESRDVDKPEAFYEYVANSVGDMKPHLKMKLSKEFENQQKKRSKKSKKTMMEAVGLEKNEIDMSNVLMLIHKPQNIIILETSYGSKLGYVELADRENIPVTNITQQLSTIIGRIATINSQGVNSQEEILSKIVRIILKKIIKQNSNSGKNDDIAKVLNSLNPEVYNTIKKLIIETDKDNPKRSTMKKLKARFIPIDRMFQYTVPSPEYFPYGVSFIEPLVLQGKLYILSQLSNIIMKLSRAAPINSGWRKKNKFGKLINKLIKYQAKK